VLRTLHAKPADIRDVETVAGGFRQGGLLDRCESIRRPERSVCTELSLSFARSPSALR
jgi:hypothetical protein